MMNKVALKKLTVIITLIILCLPLYGCWDYVGLNEVGIVIGVAVDKDINTGNYKLTCEIIDLQNSSKEKGTKTTLVETEGVSLFDAVRNAKSRSATKMFFGSMEILIISEQIAKEEGIENSIDLFIRDAEPRETINVLISQEKTAKDLLKAKGITNSILSTEIKTIIKKDHQITSKTGDIEMFQVYEILSDYGWQLTLPAFHAVTNNEQQTVESNGIAIFNGDKLIGYLSPDDTFYYLLATDEVQGGVFAFNYSDNDTITLEINTTKTKTSYVYDKEKDKFKMTIEPAAEVFIGECKLRVNDHSSDLVEEIQKKAQEDLSKEIKRVIKEIQTKYVSDIFGFGNLIYRKDPDLWDKVSKDWDKYFAEMEIEVKPTIKIVNTGFIKN